jgi:hypothetical protein
MKYFSQRLYRSVLSPFRLSCNAIGGEKPASDYERSESADYLV